MAHDEATPVRGGEAEHAAATLLPPHRSPLPDGKPLHWRNLSGYRQRRLSPDCSRPELVVVEYAIPVPADSPIAQRTLLFLADVHWPAPISGLVPRCIEIWRSIQPDWVVFGGDLTTYTSHLSDAFRFLQSLPKPNFQPAIAVYGNWDRRRRWFPHQQYRDALAQAGFRLLVNESCSLGGITFHGLDEPRIGHPEMSRLIHPHPFTGSFHCLVSHSVEPVVAAFPESFPFQLSLCGHSHGGQIRIPGFGALLTSCRHWKRFEYGLYQHRACPSSMIVTAGIGCSRIPFRLFCQPEVVLVRFSPTR